MALRIGILGHGSIGIRHHYNAVGLGYPVIWHDPMGAESTPRYTVIHNSDAIIVASPSEQHAVDFMEAGKHVLVEKPFGYDCPPLLDGYLMSIRKLHPHRIVATGFNLRFHYCVQEARKALEEGILGEFIAASFTVNQKTEKEPYLRDGLIRNWLSHEIDLAHYLLGDGRVTRCTATLDDKGRDTIDANIEMKFPSVKEKVFINGDYYTDPEQRYFWIEGTKANLYVNLIRREIYFKEKNKAPRLFFQAHDTFNDNYLSEMSYFLKSIETSSHQSPLATGEDGVRALYTVMDAYSVLHNGHICERPDKSPFK